MDFDIILEAAKCLGKNSDVAKLTRLKELSENQRFYVTVWGHYSAGKSRLINNLFSRDILPVQTRETTAVLTYIQYGTHEECVLVYEDGTASNYELSILKDVFQKTSRFEGVSKIDHIEVYINDDLLNSGLILVDTPGVNTIIQKHQDLAVDAIEQSGRILYVLGNAPTNVDRQFIKQIADCGVRISFIRTKCDRFVETEENAEISLQKEENDLMAFAEIKTEYISVSNESDSKWFANISKVRELLKNLSMKISEEMMEANNERLTIFGTHYVAELNEEEKRLEDLINGNSQKLNDEIEKCESEINALEEIVSDLETKIETRVGQAKTKSQKEIDSFITKRIEEFVNALSNLEPSANVSDEVRAIYTYHISITVEKIQRILNGYFDEILKNETDIIISCLSDEALAVPVPTYAEVQQENSRILEMYNSRLLEAKIRVERILAERRANGDTLSEIEAGFDENAYVEALALLDQELAEIPSGMALRLAEHQDLQPSSVFKAIGSAADIALLLLPGDVVFKGIKAVTNTTKVAQVLHKMGKAGEVIVKAGTAVGKNAKAIDKVRDISYALNTVLGKRKYSTKAEKAAAERLVDKAAQKGKDAFESFKEDKKSGNVLDALSVAYWTEKSGKQFDSAPKMEIDTEEQERRNQIRKQITVQQQQLSEERFQKKKELGLLQDKENELKALTQEEEIKKQRIEEEIIKQEKLVMQQVRQKALDKYRRDYKVYYGDSIIKISSEICEQYFKSASQNITMYVANQSSEVVSNIESKKSQINNLLEIKESGNGDMEEKLSECRSILGKLEMIG